MKPKLAISFSGGRTSAMMTALCLEKYKHTHEIAVTFANTGQEHDKTLDFVDRCDRLLGFPTIWLEAQVTHGERVGIRHKIVDYFTASRKGEPFEQYIRKYGIPNAGSPQCTSRLKTEAMDDYLKSIGFIKGEYKTAIGIRADEGDRMSSKMDEYGFVYPLVTECIRKADVLEYWRNQPFDLELSSEAYGNCTWCWKKSYRKLMTLAVEAPGIFDFPRRMEQLYGTHKAENVNGRRNFFRQDKTVADIFAMAQTDFIHYTDGAIIPPDQQQSIEWDIGSACGESCEIGADQ